MNALVNAKKAIALAALSVGLSAGCASPTTVRQYQDELRNLREELTNLKKERRDLLRERDQWEAGLAEASVVVPLDDVPNYPELEGLGGVDVYLQGQNVVISIESSVSFPSGKAELTKGGRDTLRTIAQVLKNNHAGGEYWIEGHTDSDPIRTSGWPSNRDLSVARAMAVLHFLVEQCGIPDDSCVVAGHGQYEPVASNSDSAGKAKNRRVEIVVHAAQG